MRHRLRGGGTRVNEVNQDRDCQGKHSKLFPETQGWKKSKRNIHRRKEGANLWDGTGKTRRERANTEGTLNPESHRWKK